MAEFITGATDVKEAEFALVDLRIPKFHHEVVYSALVLALDGGTQRERVGRLLRGLSVCGSGVINDTQLEAGVRRVYAEIDVSMILVSHFPPVVGGIW